MEQPKGVSAMYAEWNQKSAIRITNVAVSISFLNVRCVQKRKRSVRALQLDPENITAIHTGKDDQSLEDSKKYSLMKKDSAMKSLSTKTANKFDSAFITAMTAHHKAAISMAKLAQKKSTRKEILRLAKNIIAAQSVEIDQMKVWQSKWKNDIAAHHTAK